MTSRERVTMLLNKQIPDQMGLYEHFWGEVFHDDCWLAQGYPKDNDPVKFFDYDLVNCGGWFDTSPILGQCDVIEGTDEWKITRDGRGAILKYWKNRSGCPEHIGFEITTREIRKKYRNPLLALNPQRLGNMQDIKNNLANARARGKFAIYGNIFVFELLRGTIGDKNFLPALLEDPDWINDFCKVYLDHYIAHYSLLFREAGVQGSHRPEPDRFPPRPENRDRSPARQLPDDWDSEGYIATDGVEKKEVFMVNTAMIPVPKLEEDSYDWYARHETILKIGQRIDPEIVLIGDSITHFWCGEPKDYPAARGPLAWQRAFGQFRTLNMGFGWDRVQNVLWRLDHGEFDGLHPRLIILNIGTNNLTGTANARENTPAEIVEGIGEIVRRLRTFIPDVRIIQMGVFPRGQSSTDDFRPKITEINRLLALTASERNVEFLDIGPKMLQPDGSISPEIMDDFTHPTEKGYQIWADAIAPLLTK